MNYIYSKILLYLLVFLPVVSVLAQERVDAESSREILMLRPTFVESNPFVELSQAYPITLESGNECYIFLKEAQEATPPSVVYARGEDGRLVISDPIENATYRFRDLKDGSYDAFSFDVEGNVVSLGNFSTSFVPGGFLSIDAPFYQQIRAWKDAGKLTREKLFDAIRSADMPSEAVASVLQRYFYKGEVFESIAAIFSTGDSYEQKVSKSAMTCNCEGVSVPPNFIFNPGYVPEDGVSTSIVPGAISYDDDYNKLEYYTQNAGPAKMWYAYSDGWREDRNELFGATIGFDPGAINPDGGTPDPSPPTTDQGMAQRIAQSFMLVCDGGAFEIPNCECKQDIRIRWEYNSVISTRAETGSGSGTKRSVAAAEDIAIGYAAQEMGVGIPPTVTVAGGFRNFASNTCNAVVTDNFTSNFPGFLIRTGILIAGGLLVGDGFGDLPPPAQAGVIQAGATIGNGLANNGSLFNTTEYSGNCSSTIDRTRQFVQMIPFQLEPNKALIVGIGAESQMTSRGMRSWQSEVTLRSNFSLAAFLPEGVNAGSAKEGCCFPRRQGYYWTKTLDVPDNNMVDYQPILSFAPPQTDFELRNDLANWYCSIVFDCQRVWNFPFVDGRRVVDRDYRYILSARLLGNESCILPTVPSDPFPGGTIFGGGGFTTPTGGAADSRNSVLVYSIDGKMIRAFHPSVFTVAEDVRTESELMLVAQEALSQSQVSLPAGIYIVRFPNVNLYSGPRAVKILKN